MGIKEYNIRKGKIIHILILIHLLPLMAMVAQENKVRFHRIPLTDGLSQCTIRCMLQDSIGFMWFGTDDGLNRYDGYDFKVYRHEPDDNGSLSNNSIRSILLDHSGVLWVGTFDGLNVFDMATETFTRFQMDRENQNSLRCNSIRAIYEDRSGTVWVGTETGGLSKFDRNKNQFIHFQNHPEDPNSLIDNSVYGIFEDVSGCLWVGTQGGLERFNGETGVFSHFVHHPDNPESISSNHIWALLEDQWGSIWIGTDKGLNRFVPNTGTFDHYHHDPDDPNSLSDDLITVIYEDHDGGIWIGTEGDGVDKYDPENDRFLHFRHNPLDLNSLSHNTIWSLFEDRSHVLWVGTGTGLNQLYLARKPFIHYYSEPSNSQSLSDNEIWAVHEDKDGVLWIGSELGGITRFDRNKYHFTHYKNDLKDAKSLSDNCVMTICEDRFGTLWFGTYFGGLNKLNLKDGTFSHYLHDPNDSGSPSDDCILSICEGRWGGLWLGTDTGTLNKFDPTTEICIRYIIDEDNPNRRDRNEIWTLYEDPSGLLWIGTDEGGLVKFNPEEEIFTHYRADADDPNHLSNNSVMAIHAVASGHLWIGTGGGLNQFDPQSERFRHYRVKDGLPNDVIYGILEDDGGCLWLSTNNGLSKFNPRNGTFRNYDLSDGLQNNEFNSGAFCKSPSGMMFFGGVNGLNEFVPENIRDDPVVPPVAITDFRINNLPVSIGAPGSDLSVLEKSITETEEIRIHHSDRILTFQFAALHYASPEKNQYAYWMEGFDEAWHHVGDRRLATYTNLPAGDYTFRVKSSNNDGVWNEEGVSLQIKMILPFWMTWWFRGLALFLLVSLGFIVQQVRVHAVRRRERELEGWNKELRGQIEQRERAEEHVRKSLQEKEVLLKEIHHRVKNNLQVISSLLNLQAGYIQDEKALQMFLDSQTRVRSMAIIHEKLYQSEDFVNVDFAEYVRGLVKSLFQSYQYEPGRIGLSIDVQDVPLNIQLAVPCGLIINELISNALKYAFPEDYEGEGRIEIYMRLLPENTVQLMVGDNGVGMDEDIDIAHTESLGLKLVTILVEDQLDGEMHVDRQIGTKFAITFKNNSQEREIAVSPVPEKTHSQ